MCYFALCGSDGVISLRRARGDVTSRRRVGGNMTSLCARTRGEPSSAHCEQRLSERLTPCPCDPVCACTGMRGHAEKEKSGPKGGKTMQPRSPGSPPFLSAYPHAAQRAVPGWRGGLGRVGADLASAGSMRPPPSPARHVSTARHATTHASQETAGYANTARLATTTVSRETAARHGSPPHTSGEKQQTPNDRLNTLA